VLVSSDELTPSNRVMTQILSPLQVLYDAAVAEDIAMGRRCRTLLDLQVPRSVPTTEKAPPRSSRSEYLLDIPYDRRPTCIGPLPPCAQQSGPLLQHP